jgi:hypothetical protein
MLDLTKRYIIRPSSICSCDTCKKFKGISFLIEYDDAKINWDECDYYIIDDTLNIKSNVTYPERDLIELGNHHYINDEWVDIGEIDKDELWKL